MSGKTKWGGDGRGRGGTSCIPLSPLDKGHKTQLEVFVASAVIHVGWRACLAGGWGGGWRVRRGPEGGEGGEGAGGGGGGRRVGRGLEGGEGAGGWGQTLLFYGIPTSQFRVSFGS